MSKRIKNFKRRSISIPEELDKIIEYKYRISDYSFINDMIVELLELGLIKLSDNDFSILVKAIGRVIPFVPFKLTYIIQFSIWPGIII